MDSSVNGITLETLLFVTTIGFIFNHELDAIRREEWRFFFGWTGVSDETAFRLFTAAHLPLFGFILLAFQDVRFQTGFSIFMIGHALAHYLLRNHPLIRFNNGFSRFWIYGGAALGLFHLFSLSA